MNRLQRISFLLLALLFLFPAAQGVFCQESPNALQNIQLIPLKDYERIELIFANNFTQTPIVDFDTGFIFLRLNATSISVPTRQYVFPESSQLVKAVRATQNQNSTLVEIILNAPNLSLESKVKIKMNGQRLWVDLDRRVSQPLNSEPATTDISQEVEQRLRTDGQLTATESDGSEAAFLEEPAIAPPLEENWMMTLITLILSLLLIFVVLFLFLFFYKKLFFGRLPAREGKFKIRTVSTFHIGPKQKVIVLEVGTQYFACGVTNNSITFLSEVGNAQDQSFLKNVSVQEEEIHFNVDQTRADFLKTMEAARKKSQAMQKPRQTKPVGGSTFEGMLEKETKSQTKRTQQASDSAPPQKPPAVQPDLKKEAPEVSPPKPATKSFDTPVLSEAESNTFFEEHLENDASLQQFAKKLSSRLKMLKPIE